MMITKLLWPVIVLMSITIISCTLPTDLWLKEKGHNDKLTLFMDNGDELRVGLSQDEIERKIPCIANKGESIYEGATEEYIQEWNYPQCGLVIIMGSEPNKPLNKNVRSIIVKSPSTVRTKKGIHIGSQEAEVVQAYGLENKTIWSVNDVVYVVGSIYDGIIIKIKQSRVYEIFLGSAAE